MGRRISNVDVPRPTFNGGSAAAAAVAVMSHLCFCIGNAGTSDEADRIGFVHPTSSRLAVRRWVCTCRMMIRLAGQIAMSDGEADGNHGASEEMTRPGDATKGWELEVRDVLLRYECSVGRG